MRAKIVADAFVVLSVLGVLAWWAVNAPFPKPADQTISQGLAVVLSVLGMSGFAVALAGVIIHWIHGEK